MARVNTGRLEQLQKYLVGRRMVTLEEIHAEFNVSIATARRDLDCLAQNGVVERIRGGAFIAAQASPQLPVFVRRQEQIQEKALIGLSAASLVAEGEAVFLGGGTTVLEVAKNLIGRKNITVVTNSILVINALADQMDVRLVIVGGIFRPEEQTVYGHFSERMLEEINADKVIFGAQSINLNYGVMNDLTNDVSTDQAFIQTGRVLILVADHTKFNRLSTVSICSLERLQTIVTDRSTSPEMVKSLRERGIEVIIAS